MNDIDLIEQSSALNQVNLINFFLCELTASYAKSSFNLIISKTKREHTIEFLASLLKLLEPQGRIAIATRDTNQIVENLKLAGFVKTDVRDGG